MPFSRAAIALVAVLFGVAVPVLGLCAEGPHGGSDDPACAMHPQPVTDSCGQLEALVQEREGNRVDLAPSAETTLPAELLVSSSASRYRRATEPPAPSPALTLALCTLLL